MVTIGGWVLAIQVRRFKEGNTASTHLHIPSTQVMHKHARIYHTRSLLTYTHTCTCMHNHGISGMERPLEIIQFSDIQCSKEGSFSFKKTTLASSLHPQDAREHGLNTTALVQAPWFTHHSPRPRIKKGLGLGQVRIWWQSCEWGLGL